TPTKPPPTPTELPIEITSEPTATDLPVEIPVESTSPISPVPTATQNDEEASAVDASVTAVDPIPGSKIAIEAAIAHLAEEIGVNPEVITLTSIEAIQWPDSSLGCPQEGFFYAQVITPGFKIVLEAEGNSYPYHTDQDINVVLCQP
ncbi:MAG: hypothetical protein AAF485_32890, partial [Chloroflexota bacterium]